MANSLPTVINASVTQSYANTITRLGGYDRHGTAVEVADYGWTSTTKAVLAPSGDLSMVDALASSSLAKAVDGPILLSNKDSVTPETLAELKKLGVTKVYIVSGTAVISTSVEAQLTAEGITSVRLGGYDRFETAVNIAKELQQIKPFTEVAIANGFASADAISIGAIAASKGIPILVVDRDTIPSTVSNFLATVEVEKSYVIGGTAVVSDAVKVLLPKAERLAGLDRFDTNREVLKKFEDVIAGGKLFFANGADSSLVDALTGAPMAAKLGGAIVLANKNAVPSLTKTFVNTNLAIKNPGILGGTAVMSESAVKELCYADPTTDAVQTGAIGLGTVDATLEDVTVNGSVMLGADGQTLKNVIVNGTVFVDPGENGSATLENVKATKIVVLSGASNSVHLIGTTANNLLVSSNSPNTHVVVEGDTNLASVLVQSNGSLDVADEATVGPVVAQSRQSEQINVQLGGTFTNDVSVGGSVRLTAETGTTLPSVIVANETVEGSIELAGLFTQVSIADNSSVTLVSGRVAAMDAVESSRIIVNRGAEITTLTAPSGSTVSGGGDVNGTTTTETPVVVPEKPPVVVGGGGSENSGDRTVLVSAITVSSAATENVQTIQMSATVAPTNATKKTVTWSVEPLGTEIATIDAMTGILTAIGVGIVTVKAVAKDGSLVEGTKVVTVHAAATSGAAAVNLGKAGNYAILAKTGISTVPTSAITGNIGVSPIAASGITGFSLAADATNVFATSPQITGKAYAANYTFPTPSNLTTAISNMETAYTDAAGRAANHTGLGAGEIGGLILSAGVYKWSTGVLITTDVTLDGGANDVFIFEIAGGITQANDKRIILTGGAQAKNIFWQSADTVTIGTGAHFEGIILGKKEITLGTNASINGRLLSQTAVTLKANRVVAPVCDSVTLPVAVTDINVTETGSAAVITTDNGTLQMLAEVLPTFATSQTVTWTVTNGTGTATINAEGLLTAVTDGTVTVTATSVSAGTVNGSAVITLSNQKTVNVANLVELKVALGNANFTTINITANIASIPEALVINHALTINGGDKTLTFTAALNLLAAGERQGMLIGVNGVTINNLKAQMAGATGWQGVYGIQVYNATDVTLNNVTASGADGGILVNGSAVELTGVTTVTGNEFGGIEVSKGTVLTNSALTVTGTLANASEVYGRPTIWVVTLEGAATGANVPVTKNTTLKTDQTQYYMTPANAVA